MRRFVVGGALVACVGMGLVLAQEKGVGNKPVDSKGTDPKATAGLKAQIETAIKSKDYLRDLRIEVREEDGGKISIQGEVPQKVHCCALYLICMGTHGVTQCDLSKVRILHWGSEPGELRGQQPGAPTQPQPAQPQAQPGQKPAQPQASQPNTPQAQPSQPAQGKRVSLYAVVQTEDRTSSSTQPASAHVINKDIIIVGDVPAGTLPQGQTAPNGTQNRGTGAGGYDPTKDSNAPGNQGTQQGTQNENRPTYPQGIKDPQPPR